MEGLCVAHRQALTVCRTVAEVCWVQGVLVLGRFDKVAWRPNCGPGSLGPGRFKRALFLSVATGCLSLGATAANADDACVVDPAGTVTCQGDQSEGVLETRSSITTLNVKSLDLDIVPEVDTAGVKFSHVASTAGGGSNNATGTGGGGGNGSTPDGVTIDYDGDSKTIITESAPGIHGISRGGNGGGGGSGTVVGVYGRGGGGGKGADGGSVTIVSSSGKISTSGEGGHGILAESIGGNGGNGGTGFGLEGTGGNGGDGGGGGAVDVTNYSEIETKGKVAYGIFGQSVGGKGGNGGSGDGVVGGGGGGGGAEPGGLVTINNHGKIGTEETDSHGIFAQSVGGFGGAGGDSSGLVAFGSSGRSGGAGGEAQVNNFAGGVITTKGSDAMGIFAQSVGGGGGDGGSGSGLAGIGGSGASTSAGGTVTVVNEEDITTHGDRSRAIFAQSVGGGGGNGGMSAGIIAIGGSGGGGGDGKTVVVSNSGNLSTGGAVGGAGDDAVAVFLQSVGGGGGNGGAAYAGGAGASVAIGGQGGKGGVGGNVTFNAVGGSGQPVDINSLTGADILTTGNRSHGIQAQSVGGGGGNGGFAFSGTVPVSGVSASLALGGAAGDGGNSGNVLVNEKGSIETKGDQAIGIFAQSVGGGGGNGGGTVAAAVGGAFNLSVAVGGTGGKGGEGNLVTVNAVGSIETSGAQSHGILAQSVGGGGGNGGFALSAAGTSPASAGGFAAAVSLGGLGGEGNIAKKVTVTTSGTDYSDATISTTGEGAVGILAQSIGGGGGNGGIAGSVAPGQSAGVGVSLGGSGGGGAVGGEVSVTNAITVTTTGNIASAVFAQSVGGGGGNGGAAISGAGGVAGVSVALGGSGGKGSEGGKVYVNNSGSITTGKAVDPDQVYGNLSYGIFAQSVGGGGGNGGFSISAALGIACCDLPGGAAAVSVGGTGGAASDGGQVTVDNSGNIETHGLGAHAIFAQSVGGGGGNGGFAGSVAMTVGTGASFGVAIGGSASGGGNAGTVVVNDTSAVASIITYANGADGVHAQSVGGGGGDGGYALAGAFGFGGEASVNVAVAIGGKGGEGGTGGTVDVTTYSRITTQGHNANGIMAQSVGGGGGNGGMAVTGTLAFSEKAGAVGVSVGGAGGSGNFAGKVKVDNYGQITTWGNDAMGILAHSIGGSGGNGGMAIAAQMTGATKTSATVGISIGGEGGSCELPEDGGACNSGGIVEVTNFAGGTIETNGLGSHGIKAQSVGGGGGNGGLAAVAQLGVAKGSEEQASKSLNFGVSIGGKGGKGGFGNTVHVINDGAITIKGQLAVGIFAQSVGGGGGEGGGAVSAIGMLTDSANKSSRSVTATVTLGGEGGEANIGGKVTVENSGSIVTKGVSGYGVYAQSVGGGGGIGGRANSLQLILTEPVKVDSKNVTNKNSISLGVTIGGNGGTGGHGGNVFVDNTGSIETWNETSDGIFAESIGGGGGNGGNGGLGLSDFGIPEAGTILEKAGGKAGAKNAVKMFSNLQAVVGGSGGATGDGGTVEVQNNKNITTHGSNSDGIFAHSIGGGGGVGGRAAIGLKGTLGVGGEGGAAGDGAQVTVNQYDGAVIETFGVASNGIFAQSVGGGGGVAGNVDRFLASGAGGKLPSLNVGAGLAFGRSGGKGGNGGAVDVDVDGAIITHGDNATGIFAHSVGGGGGVIGELGNDVPVLSLLSWQVGSNGDTGNAGEVNVGLTGTISTAGNNATGIFAQSAGGKAEGGVAGKAENVTVTVDGAILTGAILGTEDGSVDAPLRGLGSSAIIAQSAAVANKSNGNVVININGANSIVRGGGSKMLNPTDGYVGVGVWVLDGTKNSVTNYGTITTVNGVDGGYAILATGSDETHTGGDETIDNYNTVIGNVALGSGINTFNNKSGSRLWAGSAIDLGGHTRLFSNEGVFAPGGSGEISTVWATELNGKLEQASNGVYQVDLDFVAGDAPTGLADHLSITGEATLDGSLEVVIVNPDKASTGYREVTVLSASGGVTNRLLDPLLLDAPVSAVAAYQIHYPTVQDVVLSYDINFSPAGLNTNQAAIGEFLNELQLAGGSSTLDPLVGAVFGIGTLEELKATYNILSPEAYASNVVSALVSTNSFSNAMMSCRQRGGDYKFVSQDECGWMRVAARSVEYHGTSKNLGFVEDSYQIAGGVQKAIGQNWHLGLSVSYEDVQSSVGDLASIDGHLVQGGMVIKGRSGATTWAGSVAGGHGWFDTQRAVNIADLGGVAEAMQELSFISGGMQVAHSFEHGDTYFRPMFEAAITSIHQYGFSETGGGLGNLAVEASDELYVALTPSLEIGAELALGDGGNLLRPRIKLGVTRYVGDENPTVTSRLVGTPDNVASFSSSAGHDKTLGNVEVGFDLLTVGGVTIRMDGLAQFGENTELYQGDIKVTVPF